MQLLQVLTCFSVSELVEQNFFYFSIKKKKQKDFNIIIKNNLSNITNKYCNLHVYICIYMYNIYLFFYKYSHPFVFAINNKLFLKQSAIHHGVISAYRVVCVF